MIVISLFDSENGYNGTTLYGDAESPSGGMAAVCIKMSEIQNKKSIVGRLCLTELN